MSLENTAVAVFDGHQKVDDAVRALGRANFPVAQLTIVAKKTWRFLAISPLLWHINTLDFWSKFLIRCCSNAAYRRLR